MSRYSWITLGMSVLIFVYTFSTIELALAIAKRL